MGLLEVAGEQLERLEPRERDQWPACVVIQTEEGHNPSPDPAEDGPFLSIDVDIILKTLCDEEEMLVATSLHGSDQYP